MTTIRDSRLRSTFIEMMTRRKARCPDAYTRKRLKEAAKLGIKPEQLPWFNYELYYNMHPTYRIPTDER